MKHLLFLAAGMLCLSVLSACNGSEGDGSSKVNGSVHVAAGTAATVADTVNGSIVIDEAAAVTSATTVNGGIKLGSRATADSLKTVNGSITVEADAHVAQGIEAVNGGIILRKGGAVQGSVVNVNGKIELSDAHVGAGIRTVNGSIMIFGASHVEGGIQVDKTSGQWIHFGDDEPRIEIGPGAVVQGELRFERKVKLYVSDRATIGPVSGATPITFTGETAPAG